MDPKQIEQAEQLVELFQTRELLLYTSTSAIFDFLSDPILTHLTTFFNSNDVTWTDIELDIPSLIISCTINYTNAEQIPDFMNILAPAKDDESTLSRAVKIRIPIALMFTTTDQAMVFLNHLVESAVSTCSQPPAITKAVDVLTEEQQILLFHLQKETTGSIH